MKITKFKFILKKINFIYAVNELIEMTEEAMKEGMNKIQIRKKQLSIYLSVADKKRLIEVLEAFGVAKSIAGGWTKVNTIPTLKEGIFILDVDKFYQLIKPEIKYIKQRIKFHENPEEE